MEELADDILFGLKNVNIDPAYSSLLFITTIKDGGDGMGEMAVYKEKNDRFLPDKALRFSFCLIKTEVVSPSDTFTVFKEKSPNYVRNTKPLLESLADENNKSTIAICIAPNEFERKYLQNRIIKVKTT